MPVSEKKLRSNPAWIKRHLTDPFVKKSVQEGYRARSVYKLMEIDDKDKIIKPGMSVVDLGAAPGSWTQIVKERLTDKDGKIDGKVIAMDILPMEPIEGVHFLQGDFREQEVADKLTDLLEGEKVDVVLSDMAPNLSGVAAADAARCLLLNELALDFAKENLKKNGSFVARCFRGAAILSTLKLAKKLLERFPCESPRPPEVLRQKCILLRVI